ncbi:PITH domain-containing protein 1-like isoform X1 [Haliotis rubra]|uniref:PITH domain-containing protein 1-like isoform X1 n=1 Tax=Haliotis rubra TaxID=36100 RepID=UPI001EE56623|nr:PITH domain-containing protein 1-like isoform X1 [Haliotis rubra]
MSGHGHGHGHGHDCGGGHDHPSESEMAAQFSLYTKIDTERVECLNETLDGSGRTIFKPWDQRLDKDKYVESDVDEELIFNIPFTGSVKLKGVIVIGGQDDSHPSRMRLFKNRPGMTFDDVSIEAEQEYELHPDPEGMLEYATKAARFNSVEHLTIHFPGNFGNDSTLVYYIGLRGDFTQARRHEVTICTYEARANPSDHKTNVLDSMSNMIS